jgi:hypothetical protein
MKLANSIKLNRVGIHPAHIHFGNPSGGTEGPCYITFCTVPINVNTLERAHALIEVAADENKRGILILSVTEKDGELCHESVKKAAMEYEGATITESISRWHGNYKVWMISIPIL